MNRHLSSLLSPTLQHLWRSQHLLLALDTRAHIIDANPPFCDLLQHPPNTLVGRALATLSAPETPFDQPPTTAATSAPAEHHDMLSAIFDKRHHPHAFTLLGRNGHRVPLHVVETWLIKNSGALIHVLVLASAENKTATLQALETYFDEVIHNTAATPHSLA